jgi:hypothetical protein
MYIGRLDMIEFIRVNLPPTERCLPCQQLNLFSNLSSIFFESVFLNFFCNGLEFLDSTLVAAPAYNQRFMRIVPRYLEPPQNRIARSYES